MRGLSYKPVKPVSPVERHLGQAYNAVDLAYKPADIDAQAAAVLNSSVRSVKHILDHRAHLDQIGLQNQPMVVMIGEKHSNVAHRVNQILILKQLISKENIAFAFEESHNSLALLNDEEDPEYAAYKKQMRLLDRETCGTLSLKNAIAGNYDLSAPLSKFALDRLLLKNNIKTFFCDVARDVDGCVDQKDISSLESLRVFAGRELPDSVSTLDELGMAVRNHHMAKMVMDFAALHQPRIVVLQCGAAHVMDPQAEGFSNDGKKFEGKDYTLPSFFKRAAFPSVAIVQSVREGMIPDNSMRVCGDLPNTYAVYNPATGEPFREEYFYHIRSAKAELSYFNALMSRTGCDSEKVSLADWKSTREQCEKDMSEHRDRAWDEVFMWRRNGLLDIA